MAGTHRQPTTDLTAHRKSPMPEDLNRELLSRGHAFSFFQALRLLNHGTHDTSGDGTTIRMRPSLSLGFPPGDIDRIDHVEGGDGAYFQITTTFLGLYGASSPLPTFYTEDLLTEKNEDESVSRDFLDIIHQRLYELVYQGWLKYRQYLQVVENRNKSILERLYCLVGLGSEALQSDGHISYALLRYIGLMTQYPRSALGLKTLLRDALAGLPLEILPCRTRIAQIPRDQQCRLGMGGNALGGNSYVGAEIEDRMGKMGIRIGPLDQAEFLRFTPGNEGYAKLTALTSIYLTDPLIIEVELVLAANQAQTLCLGDPMRGSLGVTTWVFSEKSLGEVSTRFVIQ